MFDSNAIHCTTVFKTFDRTDTAMPKVLAAAKDKIDAGNAATLGTSNTTSTSIVEAAVNAIADGRDPHDDPELQRLAVDYVLGLNSYGILEALRRAPANDAIGVIRRETDAILTIWRKTFDTAAASLTDNDPETASNAARTVDQILAGWSGLHLLSHGSVSAAHTTLRYAALDYDTINAGIERRSDVTPATLAKTGHTIALVNFDEYAKRVSAYEAEHTRRAEVRITKAISDAPIDPLGWVRPVGVG